MQLSITHYDRTLSVEDPKGDEYDIDEFIEQLIVPLMCAMEYDQESVRRRLDVQ